MSDDPYAELSSELLRRIEDTGHGAIEAAGLRYRFTAEDKATVRTEWIQTVHQFAPLVDGFLSGLRARSADRRRRDDLVRAASALIDSAPPEILERIEGALDTFHAAVPPVQGDVPAKP